MGNGSCYPFRGEDTDGVVADSSLVGGSNQAGLVTDAASSPFGSPDPKLTKVDNQAQVGGDSESSGSLPKSETLGRKGFALQDKVILSWKFIMSDH